MAVRKRGKSYVVDIYVNGRRTTKTFKRKKDAERYEREMLHRRDTGQWVEPDKQLFGDFLSDWLEIRKSNIKTKTYDGYRYIIESHVIPAIGNIPLDKLNPIHLQKYYASKLKVLSPKTVRNHHNLIRVALKMAVKWKKAYYNVADAVELPSYNEQEVTPLDINELSKLFKVVKNDTRIFIPILLAGAMGMRAGEVYGLKWDDINFEECYLTINRALQRNSEGLVFVYPKTEKSKRAMLIPKTLLLILKKHKVEQSKFKLIFGADYQDNNLVNCQPNGTPWDPNSNSKYFRKIADSLNLNKLRFHDLRHSNITLLMEKNIHSKKIAGWAGHSTTKMVDERYAHLRLDMQKEITQVIECDLLSGLI